MYPIVFIMLTKCLIFLCFAVIMSRVDPNSVNYLKQLRRQTTTRKSSSFELIGTGNPNPSVDVVPPATTVPLMNPKKRR